MLSNKNINKIPKGIALRPQRICDTAEKYVSRADEYKNYLLARDYINLLLHMNSSKRSAKCQENMQEKANLKLIKTVRSNL